MANRSSRLMLKLSTAPPHSTVSMRANANPELPGGSPPLPPTPTPPLSPQTPSLSSPPLTSRIKTSSSELVEDDGEGFEGGAGGDVRLRPLRGMNAIRWHMSGVSPVAMQAHSPDLLICTGRGGGAQKAGALKKNHLESFSLFGHKVKICLRRDNFTFLL